MTKQGAECKNAVVVSKKMKDCEAMVGADRDPPNGPKLEPVAQNALGRELRAMYDQIVSEPVPDRFIRLLEQLERAQGDDETQRSASTSNR